jgi:hypothetical protein
MFVRNMIKDEEEVDLINTSHDPNADQRTRRTKADPSISIIIKNLSYFCQEQHLFQLLLPVLAAQSKRLISLKIERSPTDGHSLLHAFAELPSMDVADYLISAFDGTSFMGRFLK